MYTTTQGGGNRVRTISHGGEYYMGTFMPNVSKIVLPWSPNAGNDLAGDVCFLYSSLPTPEDMMCHHVILLFNQSKTEISEHIGRVPILMISQNKFNFEIQRRDL
jgi:hypothetical protein